MIQFLVKLDAKIKECNKWGENTWKKNKSVNLKGAEHCAPRACCTTQSPHDSL